MDDKFYKVWGDDFDCSSCKHLNRCKNQETPVIDICFFNWATHKIEILKRALTLAVDDKCVFENSLIDKALGTTGANVLVPRKEQWYIERAEKELGTKKLKNFTKND